MESNIDDTHDVISTITIQHKNEIGLPLIALGFDILPILIVFLRSLFSGLSSFVLLFILVSPIAGLIMGVVSLSRGEKRIGIVGKIIAIVAIALPLVMVALIVAFFIGVATGVISLM